MTLDITPGGSDGHMWRVWLITRRGDMRLVCACSKMDTLAFAVGSIREMVG